MHAGPLAETRTLQQIVNTVVFICFPAILWSALWTIDSAGRQCQRRSPAWSATFWSRSDWALPMLVVAQNAYAAANITVDSGQTLVSTGLYGLVRHPMYGGSAIMMVGVPLALDSIGDLSSSYLRCSRSCSESAMKKSCYSNNSAATASMNGRCTTAWFRSSGS